MVGHPLGPISTLAGQADQTGRGIYLLTEYTEKEGGSGQARLQLMLEDATGRITAFSWPERRPYVRLPPVPSAVAVQARVQLFDGKVQFKLHSLDAIDVDQVDLAAALLPRRRCPEIAHAALDRLIALERDLPAPLNGFLRQVLLDPDIGIPFGLTQPLSQRLGLAADLPRHRLDRRPLRRILVPMLQHHPDRPIPHLRCVTRHLVHGFILSGFEASEKAGAVHSLVLRHETLGSNLLEPHLRWLDHRDSELAIGMRYVFEHLAWPSAMRRIPDYLVAEVVAMLDQCSAAAHNGRDLQYLLRRGVPAAVASISGTAAANDPSHDQEVRHAG